MKNDKTTINWAKDVWTIPNLLSFLRILLLPVYLWIILHADRQIDWYFAAGLLLFSGATDFIDGWIARRFNQITELGKLLDPVADKLTQLVLAFSLVLYYPRIIWLALLLLIKECFMAIAGILLLRKGYKLDGAKWYGKVATAVFYLAIFFLLLFPDASAKQIQFLIILPTFFMLLSFLLYIRLYYHLFKEKTDKK